MTKNTIKDRIQNIKIRCRSLTHYVSRREGLGGIDYDEMIPTRDKPKNYLHRLHESGEVDHNSIVKFAYKLQRMDVVTMDIHGCPVPDNVLERLGLVSFCIKEKVFFFMPYLFQDTISPVAEE